MPGSSLFSISVHLRSPSSANSKPKSSPNLSDEAAGADRDRRAAMATDKPKIRKMLERKLGFTGAAQGNDTTEGVYDLSILERTFVLDTENKRMLNKDEVYDHKLLERFLNDAKTLMDVQEPGTTSGKKNIMGMGKCLIRIRQQMIKKINSSYPDDLFTDEEQIKKLKKQQMTDFEKTAWLDYGIALTNFGIWVDLTGTETERDRLYFLGLALSIQQVVLPRTAGHADALFNWTLNAGEWGGGPTDKDKERVEKAMKYTHECRQMYEELNMMVDVGTTYSCEANFHEMEGRFCKQLECYEKHLKCGDGSSSSDNAILLHNMGMVGRKIAEQDYASGELGSALSRAKHAMKKSEESVKMYVENNGPEDAFTAMALCNLAMCQSAECLLSKRHDGCTKALATFHETIALFEKLYVIDEEGAVLDPQFSLDTARTGLADLLERDLPAFSGVINSALIV